MIAITPFAAVNLRRMVSDHCADAGSLESISAGELVVEGDHRLGLRITVEKGGCAGMQYTMKLDLIRPKDEVNEVDGALVFVDPHSSQFINGSELDYCDDLVGTGFRLRNPKASRSCGCGTSFEPLSGEESLGREVSADSGLT